MPAFNNPEKFAFPKDIRLKCSRCALCCGDTESRSRTILMLESEAERISRRTTKSVFEFASKKEDTEPYAYVMKKTPKGSCVFLAGNLCTIYNSRPLICRFYPFKLVDQNEKYVFSVTHECPGVGDGRKLKKRFFEGLFAELKKSMRQNSQ